MLCLLAALACLPGIALADVDLSGVDLSGIDLSGIKLAALNLAGADCGWNMMHFLDGDKFNQVGLILNILHFCSSAKLLSHVNIADLRMNMY